MYLQFYGFREPPFELTPNPKYLFYTPAHREALSTLEYGLFSAKPVTVLIGEAGKGKTTLLNAALQTQRCRHLSCLYIHHPGLKRLEFIQNLYQQLHLRSATSVFQ